MPLRLLWWRLPFNRQRRARRLQRLAKVLRQEHHISTALFWWDALEKIIRMERAKRET